MSEPDDITIRRIWQLETELAAVKRMVTSPTTVLTALESDRRENDKRFDAIDHRLDGIDAKLAAILAAVEGNA